MPRKSARRLVEPDHLTGPKWIETFGPEVAEQCAAIGFASDPQQELALNIIFGIRPDGLCSCFEFGCVVCRQNLKTGLFKQVAIGWLFVTDVRWFVWSAHEMSTTRESQDELHTLIADSSLSRFLPRTKNLGKFDANGEERIELRTGQRVMFKARTVSGGRGLSAPKVILDEAFALKASMVGSLLPTLTAQPDPQVLYGSSAGKADSHVLRDVRDRGRAGASPNLAYVEWLAPKTPCADPDCKHPKTGSPAYCALDDVKLWRKANPTLTTGRIREETIANLRQALPPEEFARECLGWWDEASVAAEAVLPGWNRAGDSEITPPPVGAIGLSVSYDRSWSSIAAAGWLEDERRYLAAVMREPGTRWMVAEAARIQNETGCAVVIAKSGSASNLIPQLQDAGVDLIEASVGDECDAFAGLRDGLMNKQVVHGRTDELDDAVLAAVKRKVVDRETLARRQSGDDISMAESAMLADWALVNGGGNAVSVHGFGSLDLCDKCRERPHEDPDGEHAYLCTECREEA